MHTYAVIVYDYTLLSNFSHNSIRRSREHNCPSVDVLWDHFCYGSGWQRVGHMDSDVQQTDA